MLFNPGRTIAHTFQKGHTGKTGKVTFLGLRSGFGLPKISVTHDPDDRETTAAGLRQLRQSPHKRIDPVGRPLAVVAGRTHVEALILKLTKAGHVLHPALLAQLRDHARR